MSTAYLRAQPVADCQFASPASPLARNASCTTSRGKEHRLRLASSGTEHRYRYRSRCATEYDESQQPECFPSPRGGGCQFFSWSCSSFLCASFFLRKRLGQSKDGWKSHLRLRSLSWVGVYASTWVHAEEKDELQMYDDV